MKLKYSISIHKISLNLSDEIEHEQFLFELHFAKSANSANGSCNPMFINTYLAFALLQTAINKVQIGTA